MDTVAIPVGTKVRINEQRDQFHGREGVVVERLNYTGTNPHNYWTALVQFTPDGKIARWFRDANLEVVDAE